MSDTSLEGQSLIKQVEVAVGVLVTSPQKGRSEPLKQVLSRARDKTVVLLIDEAQGLSPLQLEELRHLTNLEVPGRKLLEIILAGQPNLKDKLASPECGALRQRIAVRTELEPLDLQHTAAYIEHRLRVAGAFDSGLFDPEAIRAIHERSEGVPRLINIICERCLVVGYVDEARTIDAARAQDAIADLKLEPDEEKKPDPPQAVAMGNGLLMRMGARIETIEEKLDLLIKLLARSGYVRPEHAQSTRMRQYLNALRGESPKIPPKKAAGQD
jgi:hypothetical protein